MANRKLIVEIVGDSKSFDRTLKNATTETKRFAVGFGTIAKTALGFAGATAGITAITSALHAGVQEFSDQQKIAAQTAAALRSTGRESGITARQIDALSLSLSNLSGIDDELIKSGENVLLSFTQIRNAAGKGNDIFTQATKAVVNFAARTGRDVPQAALVLGKALADPASKLSSLSRAGVVFTDQQLDQVKALQKTQGLMTAQKFVLAELEKRYGGAAKAAGDTLPGKLNILRERLKDVSGQLVGAFAPSFNKAADALTKFLSDSKNQASIQRNVTATTKAVSAAVQQFADVLKVLRDILSPVVRLVGGLENAVKLLVAAMIASKIVSFTSALTGLGNASAGAAGKVDVLRASLGRLAAIGTIVIAIEIIVNRKQITKKLNEITDDLPGPLPKGGTVDLTKMNLQQLLDLKKKMKGFSGPLVAELDKLIAKLQKLQVTAGGRAASKIESHRGERTLGSQIAASVDRAIGFVKKETDDALAKGKKSAADTKTKQKQAETAAEQRDKAFDALISSLGLKVDQAAATKGFQDDLRANTELQNAIKKRIAEAGNTTDLARQLFDAQQARSQILSDQAAASARAREKAAANIQAAQFKGLGLTAEGEQRTPGTENLKKQLKQLTGRLGEDISPKLANQLSSIGKVLSGAFGKVTLETRQKIVELFAAIRGEFDKQSNKPLTKTTSLNANKILQGLGLGPDATKALRSRLSNFNSAGVALAPSAGVGAFGMVVPSQTTVVHTSIDLDGRTVARSTTKHQQVTKRRNPPQKRGPHGI